MKGLPSRVVPNDCGAHQSESQHLLESLPVITRSIALGDSSSPYSSTMVPVGQMASQSANEQMSFSGMT